MNTKRILSLLLALQLLALTACGSAGSSSVAESSSYEIDLKDEPTDDEYLDLVKSFIGMQTDEARELMKEHFGNFTTEQEAQKATADGGKVKIYSYVGSVQFLGVHFSCAYIVTDASGNKIDGFGVRPSYIGDKLDTAAVTDAKYIKEIYEKLTKKLTDKFSQPKTMEFTSNTMIREQAWENDYIRVEYSFPKDDPENGIADLTLAFGSKELLTQKDVDWTQYDQQGDSSEK